MRHEACPASTQQWKDGWNRESREAVLLKPLRSLQEGARLTVEQEHNVEK